MLRRIKIQTNDGVREYPFVPDAAALKAAADAGEVKPGDEIVYKQWLVWIFGDIGYLVILERLNIPVEVFGGGMGVPPQAQWSFTVNGGPGVQ